jgi:26S proteasome regulatory subunit N8
VNVVPGILGGQGTAPLVQKVVVHPLVLLSVVDHFNRMGKIGSHRRVVGILLGSFTSKGVLDVSNSFAGQSLPVPKLLRNF